MCCGAVYETSQELTNVRVCAARRGISIAYIKASHDTIFSSTLIMSFTLFLQKLAQELLCGVVPANYKITTYGFVLSGQTPGYINASRDNACFLLLHNSCGMFRKLWND